MVKVFRIIGRVFGLIGLGGLLLALGFVTTTLLFISGAKVADGTVVDNLRGSKNSLRAVIEFPVDGRTVRFNDSVATNPPQYTTGQRVKVYYNADDPAGSARPDGFASLWFLPLLITLLAGIFGAIGLGFLSVVWVKARKVAWLRRNGLRLEAEVTGVQLNRSIRNQGRSPCTVRARWHDQQQGREVTFQSDPEWIDPAAFPNGRWVTVLVDPKNYSRYYVQLETAPQAVL